MVAAKAIGIARFTGASGSIRTGINTSPAVGRTFVGYARILIAAIIPVHTVCGAPVHNAGRARRAFVIIAAALAAIAARIAVFGFGIAVATVGTIAVT